MAEIGRVTLGFHLDVTDRVIRAVEWLAPIRVAVSVILPGGINDAGTLAGIGVKVTAGQVGNVWITDLKTQPLGIRSSDYVLERCIGVIQVAGACVKQQLGGFTELEQQLAADSPGIVVVQVLSEAVVNKPIMLGRAKGQSS